jgi:acetyl-CoA carboxylase biotin carboxyl carrier protein
MAEVIAEMVANVWRVLVAPGRAVAAGDPLVILESMKMEIPVESPLAGTVTDVRVQEGGVVQEGDVIAVVE